MQIIMRCGHRYLIKNDKTEVDIDDGSIILYSGVYYTNNLTNNITNTVEINTTFVGRIECERFYHEDGITGIYIMPLYLWNIKQNEWNKILPDFKPKNKYDFYPHLLLLPGKTYNHLPLYTLHTCQNVTLRDYEHVNTTISLENNNWH